MEKKNKVRVIIYSLLILFVIIIAALMWYIFSPMNGCYIKISSPFGPGLSVDGFTDPVYDKNGNFICNASGGITGKGNCEFSTAKCEKR